MPKQMDRYSLISTTLPFEIQIKIILIAEDLWYNDKVNMIINNWYRYMARKIAIFEISLTLSKTLSKYYNKEKNTNLINPLYIKNIQKMKYIKKYFTGRTEDIFYWKTLLRKFCKDLIVEEAYHEVEVINGDICNKKYREMNNIIFSFISKIMPYDRNPYPDPIISRWLTIYLLHNSPAITMAGY